MIKLARQAVTKASDEMLKEAGKKAGKYAARVAAIGGAAIAGNYIAHKTKEKGIQLTKDIEEVIKDGSQEIADVIQGNKKAEPIKACGKIVKGTAKGAAVVIGVGLGTVLGAKVVGYVRDSGKDVIEDVAADYRRIKYFVEEDIEIGIDEDEIEYL